MRLYENEAQTLLEEYTGPFYEIERQMAVIKLSTSLQLVLSKFP